MRNVSLELFSAGETDTLEDLKAQANGESRIGLSTPFNDRLPFAFRLTQRVAMRIVELLIGLVTPFIAPIQLFFFQ